MINVALQADYEGDSARLTATGPFDLAHAAAVELAVEAAEAHLNGCNSVDLDLSRLDRIDGAGAVLLARLCDRLDAEGRHPASLQAPTAKQFG